MFTEEEKKFIEYWERNRLRHKRFTTQLALGLPLGVGLVVLIFINFFSGWYKRATLLLNTEPSMIIVLLVATLLIVIFVTIFSARHKWDRNEQRYRELLSRKNNS